MSTSDLGDWLGGARQTFSHEEAEFLAIRLPWWLSWWRICLQWRRLWLNSWVRKICWRRDRLPTPVFLGFPFGSAGKEYAYKPGDLGLIPVLGRFPWSRERLPTPVFWPGEIHGLHSLWGCKESDTTERLSIQSMPISDFGHLSLQLIIRMPVLLECQLWYILSFVKMLEKVNIFITGAHYSQLYDGTFPSILVFWHEEPGIIKWWPYLKVQ